MSSSDTLFSYRSIGKCLSQGISFLTDHFWRVLWVSWPVAVPLAIVLAALAFHSCYLHFIVSPTADILLTCVLSVLALLAAAAYTGYIYRLIVRHAEGLPIEGVRAKKVYDKGFWQLSIKALIVSLVEIIVVCILIAIGWGLDRLLLASHPAFFHWVLASLVALVVMVVACPMTMCLPACALVEGKLPARLWAGFKLGWQRWTKVFSLWILTGIISGVVCCLLLSPAVVIAISQMQATQSELAGDVVSLPAGFAVYTFLILLISMLIASLLTWVQTVPQAYLFASLHGSQEKATATA